jgi:hypothetical protein
VSAFFDFGSYIQFKLKVEWFRDEEEEVKFGLREPLAPGATSEGRSAILKKVCRRSVWNRVCRILRSECKKLKCSSRGLRLLLFACTPPYITVATRPRVLIVRTPCRTTRVGSHAVRYPATSEISFLGMARVNTSTELPPHTHTVGYPAEFFSLLIERD